MREVNLLRKPLSDYIFDGIVFTISLIALISVSYPLILVISSSFSSPTAVVSGRVWLLPVEFSLEGYRAVFRYDQVWMGYFNSIVYTALGTGIRLFLTICAAYPLYRKDFLPRNIVMIYFVITMFFSGGLIPTYLLVRNLNMLDTIWSMIIPTGVAVWHIILMRTYFYSSIPQSLLDASQIDGCSDIKFLTKVVLPLSKPIIAVLILYSAVSLWNTYFHALIYLSSDSKFPLQIILRNILVLNQFDVDKMGQVVDEKKMLNMINLQNLMKYSLIIVSTLPVLMLYPFAQRYFIKGIMIGSIKG